MKKSFSWLIFFLLLVSPVFGASKKIIETADIGIVEKYLTDETLIFFDLDDVVFTTEDYLGHSAWFYGSVDKLVKLGLTWENATDFMSELDYEIKSILPVKAVDIRTEELIRKWQKTHLVLGLTSRTKNLSEITFRMLADVGVDFADKEALAPYRHERFSSTAKIERNVIFVSDYHSKGEMANLYLKKLPKEPTRIIFIDDKEKYLHELMKSLPDHVEFVGIRYSKEDGRVARFLSR